MTKFEAITLYMAISAYVCVCAAIVAARIFDSRAAEKVAFWIAAAGLAAQSASIIWRWAGIGHPPVFGTFENALAGSWFFVAAALILARRIRDGRFSTALLGGSAFAAIAILAFGLRFDRGKYPLTISERSLWVDLHATLAWLDYTALFVAFVAAILILRGRTNLPRRIQTPGHPADEEMIGDFMTQCVAFVFVMKTGALASGSYYELLVFGRWWGWDPVESLYLCSWLVAALYIHLRRSFAWTNRSLAVLVVISFVLSLIAYWLLVYFPPGSTFHVFDIIGREHIL